MDLGPHCTAQQIERLLREQLAAAEQQELEQHLESCTTCQQAMMALAAEPLEWQEARSWLRAGIIDGWQDGVLSARSHPNIDGGEDSVEMVLRSLAPTDDPRMLGRLGPFEIQGVIGSGGMGVVLKGFDPALTRPVAIKLLAPHLATSGSARRRFAREARAAAAVVHENVVAILSVAEARGLPYFVMPYLGGSSLERRLSQGGPLAVDEILRIALQTAAGLSAAHAQGLVHRDVKPANILLEQGVERLLLTDFGLARAADDASLTRSGVIAGTPQYMSPEQGRGEPIDARSDLFSLGSVMYAMCTGHPPFRAETSYGVLRRIIDTEPRPIREINPEIPPWLVAIIAKLHAKHPAARFGSADELTDLLEQCLAHVQQPTAAPLPEVLVPGGSPVGEIAPPTSRLTRRALCLGSISVGVAALMLVTLAAFGVRFRSSERRDGAVPPAAESPAISGYEGPASGQPDFEWEDGVSEHLHELREATGRLEAESDRLWDPGTSPADSDTSDGTTNFFLQEATK